MSIVDKMTSEETGADLMTLNKCWISDSNFSKPRLLEVERVSRVERVSGDQTVMDITVLEKT